MSNQNNFGKPVMAVHIVQDKEIKEDKNDKIVISQPIVKESTESPKPLSAISVHTYQKNDNDESVDVSNIPIITVDREQQTIRKFDNAFGKPVMAVHTIKPNCLEKNIKNNPIDDDQQDRSKIEDKNHIDQFEQCNQSSNIFQKITRFFRQFDIVLIAVLLTAMFFIFFFIVNQGFETYAIINNNFTILKIPSIIFMFIIFSIPFFIIGLCSYKLISIFLKLKTSPVIKIRSIQTILDWKQAKKEKSMKIIKAYMTDYIKQENLKKQNLDPRDEYNLKAAIEHLTDDNLLSSNDDWFNDYYNNFQQIIDKSADKIITNNAKLTAIKTALFPGKTLDSLVVLYMNIKTTNDLMALYNLRLPNFSTIILFLYIFVNTYIIAGNAEEFSEEATGKIIEEGIPAASNIFAELTTKMLGGVSPYIAEGAINYWFAKRIGDKTKHFLQPLSIGVHKL